MVGALVAVEIGASPGVARTTLECGLAFGGFAAMALWVRSNRTALDQQEWCACAAEQITVHVILSRRAEPEPAVEEELVAEQEEVEAEALSVAR